MPRETVRIHQVIDGEDVVCEVDPLSVSAHMGSGWMPVEDEPTPEPEQQQAGPAAEPEPHSVLNPDNVRQEPPTDE